MPHRDSAKVAPQSSPGGGRGSIKSPTKAKKKDSPPRASIKKDSSGTVQQGTATTTATSSPALAKIGSGKTAPYAAGGGAPPLETNNSRKSRRSERVARDEDYAYAAPKKILRVSGDGELSA